MKSIAQQLSVYVTIGLVVYCTYIRGTAAWKNEIIFERVECLKFPERNVSIDRCKVLLINRRQVRFDMVFTVRRKITTAFVHFTVYFQASTNEFRQSMVNVWDDFCSYMAGDSNFSIVGRIYPMIRKYTNINHTCPYEPGTYFGKSNNFSVNEFDPAYLVPAGRYRLDLSFHDVFKGPPFAKFRVYGSISDHRIEKF